MHMLFGQVCDNYKTGPRLKCAPSGLEAYGT